MSYRSYYKKNKDNGLWRFREAKQVSSFQHYILLILVITGIISILRFADWWFRADYVGNLWLYIILSLAFWFTLFRLILIWVSYLRIKKPPHKDAPGGLSVAIFT